MKKSVKKEIQKIISEQNLSCSIKTFKDKINWDNVALRHSLSEKFIKKFKDKVNWYHISQ